MTMAQKEKQYFRTYFEEISTTMGLVGDVKEGSVAMEIGAPSLTDLKICTDLLSKATQHRLSSETGHLFQYGCTQGDSKFVKEMTKFLTEKYGDEVDSDDILVTGGATSGLYYMTTLLFNRGDIVFVEDPTYFLAINMLRDDLELQVVPVPTTSEGLELEVLDKLLTDYRLKSKHVVTEKQPYWTMLYTVPTFNNPKGKCLPGEKCKKLVEIARRHDIFVVCDDVYNLLSYIPNDKPGENLLPAPMRLFAYDKKQDVDYKGNVVSNCSFSKILGPGMRIGWLEAPQRLLNILRFSGLMCGGGGFNNYTSGIIASVLETGMMSQHILYLQEKYKRNLDAVAAILAKDMPDSINFFRPKGGYFVWLEFPSDVNASELKAYASKKYKISFQVGNKFSASGSYKNCIRINFTHYEEDILIPAIKNLCKSMHEFLNQ